MRDEGEGVRDKGREMMDKGGGEGALGAVWTVEG